MLVLRRHYEQASCEGCVFLLRSFINVWTTPPFGCNYYFWILYDISLRFIKRSIAVFVVSWKPYKVIGKVFVQLNWYPAVVDIISQPPCLWRHFGMELSPKEGVFFAFNSCRKGFSLCAWNCAHRGQLKHVTQPFVSLKLRWIYSIRVRIISEWKLFEIKRLVVQPAEHLCEFWVSSELEW